MNLDERDWIYGNGLSAGWTAVRQARRTEALSRLRKAAERFGARAPAGPQKVALRAGVLSFSKDAAGEQARLLDLPELDYWLHLAESQLVEASPAQAWETHFRLFSPLAAAAAARHGRSGAFPSIADAEGHVHFYGSSAYLALGPQAAWKPVAVEASRRGLRVVDGRRASPWLSQERLSGRASLDQAAGLGRLRRPPAPAHDVSVQFCGPLIAHGVTMHGLASPSPAQARRFSDSLATALAHMEERDAGLSAELRDMCSTLIPLESPKTYGSVSSSYANLRGAICLSHSDDTLLQAETLIHEFCHQKINQLLTVEALLEPGQGGQVFYSPWRPDARRLRGLLLGAHAFLNVARYLIVSLSRERYPLQRRVSVMTNATRRLFEVRDSLQTVCGYAQLTEFGRRFTLGMSRELAELFHAIQHFPPALVEESRAKADAHRKRYALRDLGFYKDAGFKPKVTAFRYKQPGKEKA